MTPVESALIGRIARHLRELATEIEEITSLRPIKTNGTTPKEKDDFLTIKEVSEATGLHVSPIRKRIADKEVPAELKDGRWMIRRSDLHLIQKKRNAPKRKAA